MTGYQADFPYLLLCTLIEHIGCIKLLLRYMCNVKVVLQRSKSQALEARRKLIQAFQDAQRLTPKKFQMWRC